MRAIAVCGLWWGQGSRRPAAPARVRCRYSVESELPPPRPPGSYCDASHSDQNNKQHIIYQVSYVSVERWNRPVRRLITVWHTVRPHVSPIRREGAAGTRGRTGIRTAQPVRTNNYVLVHAPNDTFRAHASAKKNEQKTKHITSTSSRPRINRIRCVGRKNYRYVLLILVPGRELDS